MLRLGVEKKLILIVLLFVVGDLLVLGAVIWPTVRFINRTYHETAMRRQTLGGQAAAEQRNRLAYGNLNTVEAQTSHYPNHLLRPQDELIFIALLEKTAADHRVTHKVDSSNFDNPKHTYLTLSLSLGGTYADLTKYLADLEQFPYFLIFESTNISPNENRLQTGNPTPITTTMHLTFHVYVTRQ